MNRYKQKFNESVDFIPYKIYGNGNLHYFRDYFINYYNNIFNEFIDNKNVNIFFDELKNNSKQKDIIFCDKLQKQFSVVFEYKINNKWINIIDAVLYVTTEFLNKKPESMVTMYGSMTSLKGNKTELNITFLK